MIRTIAIWLLAAWAAAAQAHAQDFSGLARVDMGASRITDAPNGVAVDLRLSQGVPYRVFTLIDPPRLVVDFREVDWEGVPAQDMVQTDKVAELRVGVFRPGWTRMVADLAGPFALETSDLVLDKLSGKADLSIRLRRVAEAEFAARAGAPAMPGWDLPEPSDAPLARGRQRGEGPLVVVLDPGHGGIDPGAERDGEVEKHLMMRFARELREVLLRSDGFEVHLTRDDDSFVSLERRVAIAHQTGADVFLSLHADVLSEGMAHGAIVHTLSESASDIASARLAERHNRADMLAGVDLSGKDDVVADILMDLARMETQPRANRLAEALVAEIGEKNLPLNRRPLRSAGFSVLKAPDIPSVLLEIGFMSSPRDLANLRDPAWRSRMAEGLRDALLAWRIDDAATADLVRQ